MRTSKTFSIQFWMDKKKARNGEALIYARMIHGNAVRGVYRDCGAFFYRGVRIATMSFNGV